MGACEFTVYRPGSDMTKTFREAVDQAQYDHGHAGYTGTLAEKREVKAAQYKAVSMEEAHALAEKRLNEDDISKWGPALAVPVADGTGKVTGWVFFGLASS